MTGAHPATAPMRRFTPEPASVPEARRFITEMLVGVESDMVDTAVLLTSELVTNAVLHAGSEIELRVWARGGRLHVRVTDAAAHRNLIPRETDEQASTGRGLQLVELLASTYGVDQAADGKTVWFELWQDPSDEPGLDSDWTVPGTVSAGELRPVRLVGLPVPLFRAGQRHRDSLLRECKLHVLTHGDLFGISRDRFLLAESVSRVITEATTAQIGDALQRDDAAVAVTVGLAMTAADAAGVSHLQDVLELANAKAREGKFLTRPALPEIRAFRAWLLGQITSQLAGADPTPWAAGDLYEQAGVLDRVWSITDVDSADEAMLAANDDNILVAASAAALDLLGWDRTELIGRRITSIIPPHLRERHSVGFTNFLLTGESRIVGQPVRVVALRRDHSEVAVTLLINVKQAADGRAIFTAHLTS